MLRLTLLKFFLRRSIMCKQRVLYENKIMQDLHNYKCYGIYEVDFGKSPQSYGNTTEKNYPIMDDIFSRAVRFHFP